MSMISKQQIKWGVMGGCLGLTWGLNGQSQQLAAWELEGHSMEYIIVVGSMVGNRKWWRMMMRSNG